MYNGIESVVLLDMNRLLTLNERVENVQCGFQHSHEHSKLFHLRKVKSMQRLEAEAIRSQIQPSKQKRKITRITNSQNKKRTDGQTSEQLFPRTWQLRNPNRTKKYEHTLGETSPKF